MVSMRQLVTALKTIGEPTRLRVLSLLAHGALSVGELGEILGQSQPRLSRHLKGLTSEGLIERLPEGSWVFYRLQPQGDARRLVDAVLSFRDMDDPDAVRDRAALERVRENRTLRADSYFADVAETWDDIRSLHYPEGLIEPALLQAAGPGPFARHVDFGTGTGRMLTLFADRVVDGEGIDLNHRMLTVARSNLERSKVTHASVRHGDASAPPFPDGHADLVTIHQLLHYLDRPETVIAEAARILKPGGRLVVVDFKRHSHEFLRTRHAHRHLGFDAEDLAGWMRASGLYLHPTLKFAPPEADGIAVAIWTADKITKIAEQAA